MRYRRLWFVLALMPVFLAVGCDRQSPEPEEEPGEEVPLRPSPTAPPETGVDASEGEADVPESLPEVDLAGLETLIEETADRGQVLVIDFWATWCAPCIAMFPELHGGAKAFGDDVRMASVTLDEPGGEYERKAIQFLAEQHALEDAFLLVSTSEGQIEVVEGMGERWTDLVVPAILVYDAQGNLAGEFIDADARADRILARVRELVETGAEGGDAQARTD
ncbi:MAG: TlpA disulfide reductase family protein [Phycisphaeraceae bacterium]